VIGTRFSPIYGCQGGKKVPLLPNFSSVRQMPFQLANKVIERGCQLLQEVLDLRARLALVER
jgi:hypothetical protein